MTSESTAIVADRKPETPTPVSARPMLRTTVSPTKPASASETASPVKIDVKDLHFYYKKFEALKGISLPIREKKVTAFIGPSGCGKSTLLRVLNRIYELYPGQRATGEVTM